MSPDFHILSLVHFFKILDRSLLYGYLCVPLQVDALDMQHKTALHYAIQEHRVETARLLLEHGADPHLASRAGDDALRTACLKVCKDNY